jgi:hypothetical protein
MAFVFENLLFSRKNWLRESRYLFLYDEAQKVHKMLSGLIRSIWNILRANSYEL